MSTESEGSRRREPHVAGMSRNLEYLAEHDHTPSGARVRRSLLSSIVANRGMDPVALGLDPVPGECLA
jgi:hypothetical protein